MIADRFYQKWIVALIFIAIIAVNALANALPINGLTTGELSDRYVNLFTPAGFTFSIWGIIYLGLLGFVLVMLFSKSAVLPRTEITQLWVVNGLANMAWLFAWHYLKISSSMFIMLILLLSLIWLTDALWRVAEPDASTRFVSAVFDLYFGWITVATIANATALLVALDIDMSVFTEAQWTSYMIYTASVVALFVALKRKTWFYLLPILWAFYGIHFKHKADWGFRSSYPEVMTSLQIGFGALLVVFIIIIIVKKIASKDYE